MTVIIKITAFWDVISFSLVAVYQSFRGTFTKILFYLEAGKSLFL
jgi:hypothetical protein